MWSYELVFEHPDRMKRRTSRKVPMTQTSKTIVSDSAEAVLNHALDELKKIPDYELVGIVRRHPIVTILKNHKS